MSNSCAQMKVSLHGGGGAEEDTYTCMYLCGYSSLSIVSVQQACWVKIPMISQVSTYLSFHKQAVTAQGITPEVN